MRKAWIGIVATVAMSAVVAWPATASATKLIVRSADMRLQATHGYKAYAFAYHQLRPRRHAEVDIAVYKADEYASYSVPALFTKHRIKADLGQFGRLNLRIRDRHSGGSGARMRRLSPEAPAVLGPDQPRAKAEERLLFCFINGPYQRKKFLGRIRFQAENGYTGIHANRAKGTYFSGTAHCPRGRRAQGTFLSAEGGSVEFYASHYRGDPDVYLYASEEETAGRVSIERSAADPGNGIFDFNSDFTTAHVEPSEGPLSGSADFTAPDQWTGDLTASFPGEQGVALTGPDFTAHLRHF